MKLQQWQTRAERPNSGLNRTSHITRGVVIAGIKAKSSLHVSCVYTHLCLQATHCIETIFTSPSFLSSGSKPMARLIQRYLGNPLLLDGRKFDIRCYMLIA